MSYIAKPIVHHPSLKKNKLGLTHRDYEGSMSTLCAGCGHDSITAAIIEACFELDLPAHGVAKISGIGCSSKTRPISSAAAGSTPSTAAFPR